MRYIEPKRAAAALIWEVAANYCRENKEVTSPADGYPANAVLVAEDGETFDGILIYDMDPDTTDVVAVVMDGPAEVDSRYLVFPVVEDDPQADPPVVGATATAALKASLITQMRERSIKLADRYN